MSDGSEPLAGLTRYGAVVTDALFVRLASVGQADYLAAPMLEYPSRAGKGLSYTFRSGRDTRTPRPFPMCISSPSSSNFRAAGPGICAAIRGLREVRRGSGHTRAGCGSHSGHFAMNVLKQTARL